MRPSSHPSILTLAVLWIQPCWINSFCPNIPTNNFLKRQPKKSIHALLNVPSSSTSVLFASTEATTATSSTSSSSDSSTQQQSSANTSSSSSSPRSIEPDMQAYANGYRTATTQVSHQTLTVHNLPSDLRGTYYRSGPAMFTAGSIPPPKNTAVQPKVAPVDDGVDKERMVAHPFEGDGAVFAVTFHGADDSEEDEEKETSEKSTEDASVPKVTFRFRYIRTPGFERERKTGSKEYTSMEPTRTTSTTWGQLANDVPFPLLRHHLSPPGTRARKNTSNTRSIYFANKLLTTWEGGLPFKLDGLALSTEGASRLGGVVPQDAAMGQRFALDAAKDMLAAYVSQPDNRGAKTQVTLLEFDSKFRLLEKDYKFDVAGYPLWNDFVLTERYAVFVQPNVKVDGFSFLLGKKDPGTCLKRGEDGPSVMHLLPRYGQANAKQTAIPLPALPDGFSHANLQCINAYEETQNGKSILILDAIASSYDTPSTQKGSSSSSWPWYTTLEEYKQAAVKKSVWRYAVNLETQEVGMTCLSGMQSYFGVVNPKYSAKKHKFVYVAVGARGEDEVAPPQGIGKVNCERGGSMEMWLPEPFEFCGEPAFVPRQTNGNETEPKEDDGYLISLLFNGQSQTSEIVILDAQDVAAGPVSRIALSLQGGEDETETTGFAIPHGYHGCFASDACWSPEELERRAKLADKMEERGNRWNEVKSDFGGLGLRLDDYEEYFGEVL